MDAKETKNALKRAREAINNKQYKEAIKICKSVLKHDKTNYNALVFVAVCAEGLEEPDQAETAYQRAIETSPSQVTAWQGLTAFYEKKQTLSDEDKNGLVTCYEKIMELFKENQLKVFQAGQKLCRLHIELNNQGETVCVYETMITNLTDLSQSQVYDLWLGLTQVLSTMNILTDAQQKLLEDCYNYVIKSPLTTEEDFELYAQLYLKLLVKSRADQGRVDSLCVFIHNKMEKLAFPLELASVIMIDKFTVENSLDQEYIEDCSRKLESVKSESGILYLLEGALAMEQRNYTKCKDCLVKGLKVSPHVTSGWCLLASVQLTMHNYKGACQSVDRGIKLADEGQDLCTVSQQILSTKLKELQIQALLGIGDQESANQVLAFLKHDIYDEQFTLRAQANAYLVLRDFIRSFQLCEKLLEKEKSIENLTIKAEVHAGLNEWDRVLPCLQQTGSVETNARAMFLIGKSMWNGDNKESRNCCFDYFLKSAKLDSFYYETFLYLGYYYCKALSNLEKAVRCFQKSFELNPSNDDVGIALSDSLVACGQNEEATRLLLGVTSSASAGCAKWAWLRLGLQQLHDQDYTSSIASLQCALRADNIDFHCWESLGEAYMLRGSYTAALKVFKRACQLDSSAIYPMFQIASIKQLLGSHMEAMLEYSAILEKSPDYIPALKGLGESLIALGQEALSQFLDMKAVGYCEKALDVLTRAVTHQSGLSCLWKLLADACTVIHCVSPDKQFTVPMKLLQAKSDGKRNNTKTLNKMEVLSLGSRCYTMSLRILPDCSSLWHDLANNYFRQAQCNHDTDAARDCGKNAMNALQRALSLDPSNHSHWNALGVIASCKAVNDPALGQHCFIKSIKCESNNVWAWTNLGALYLSNDNVQLAHEAFKVAQSLNPKYVSCWVGQAIIAELVGHEDAMDLFRHTCELSNHIEACIGYGHWVVNTLLDADKSNTQLFQYCIQQMAALPAASDCLAKYLERNKDNYVAYNLHGILLENQKLHVCATQAYSSAVHLLKCSGGNTGHLNTVTCNYARALQMTGQLEAAIQQYMMIPLETVDDMSGLALTYFKIGMFKDAYIEYEKISQRVVTERDMVDVTSALAMTALKYGDVDSGKSHLFSCAQMDATTSLPALMRLLAVGLSETDSTLCVASLQELANIDGNILDDRTHVDLCAMSAMVQRLQGCEQDAKNHIIKTVHSYPWKLLLWACLADRYRALRNYGMAFKCYLVVKATKTNMCKADMIAMCLSVVGLCLTSTSNSYKKEALITCQAAIHQYPDCIDLWCCLLSCLHKLSSESDRTVAGDFPTSTQLTVNHLVSCSSYNLDKLKPWIIQLLKS